jgi:four helix bundle protein
MCQGNDIVARTLDDLSAYRKAQDACIAVSALVERVIPRADWDLRVQLAASSAAVPANIAEGFGQQSDRGFVRYLFIARGSCYEVRSHLEVAHGRQYLSGEEATDLSARYEEIARMLTGLIKYLRASDRTQRR